MVRKQQIKRALSYLKQLNVSIIPDSVVLELVHEDTENELQFSQNRPAFYLTALIVSHNKADKRLYWHKMINFLGWFAIYNKFQHCIGFIPIRQFIDVDE